MKSWIPQNYNFGQLDHTIEFIDSFWFWVNPCHTIQKGIIPILFLSPYYSYLNSNVFSAFTCMIWLTFWERWEFSCRLKLMNKLFFYMIQQSIWYCWVVTTKIVINPFDYFINPYFFSRVLLLILLPGKTPAWINWTDSTVGWDDLMKYIPFIISTTRFSKTCSWYYFHMAFQSIFFFWIYFLFFHKAFLSNSISLSFETWVLSHVPSFFRILNCYLLFLGCRESWLPLIG